MPLAHIGYLHYSATSFKKPLHLITSTRLVGLELSFFSWDFFLGKTTFFLFPDEDSSSQKKNPKKKPPF